MAKCKLTQRRYNNIIQAITDGMYPPEACEAAGISKSRYYAYMLDGKKRGDEYKLFRSFRRDVLKAVAKSELNMLRRAKKTALKTGNASAQVDLMGRRFPERWGKHTGELARIKAELKEIKEYYLSHDKEEKKEGEE